MRQIPHSEADLVIRIRADALRQVLVMIRRLQAAGPHSDEYRGPYVNGARHARMQIYDQIEAMIASEAPPEAVAASEPEEATAADGRDVTGWKHRG